MSSLLRSSERQQSKSILLVPRQQLEELPSYIGWQGGNVKERDSHSPSSSHQATAHQLNTNATPGQREKMA